MLSSGVDPSLDIQRVSDIKEAVKIPLVLHGGSGNSSEDFQKAIKAGISVVHINTELRVAYKKGLLESLQKNKDEVAPYKILKNAVSEMEKVVEEKLKVFNIKF
jgi:fructose-bisphosphate aldolase class II